MAARAIDFEGTLNPEQLAAVTHGDGPQLVLAGAGSGKTRVITYRIAWLVERAGVDPATIVAVTFTNKAAEEMRGRVEALVDRRPLKAFVGTFHRFALRLLRMYGERVGLPRDFTIFDASDQKTLLRRAFEAARVPDDSFPPAAVLAAISGAKSRLLGPGDYAQRGDDFVHRNVAAIYREYQRLLAEAGAVDFDDMLKLAVELLRSDVELRDRHRRRIRHLLVDEFQDTNLAQLALVHELVGDAGNLTAVGDEDQGIYRFRGAEQGNILDFEKSFPNAVVRALERNYRSTQTILDAATAVVDHNVQRRGKKLWTETGGGEPIVLYRGSDELDEARWIVATLRRTGLELEQTAILVRTNAQTRAIEEELLRQRLSYSLIGGMRFYERAEVKDLLAYLRFLRKPTDVHSFLRILNQPPRGIGKTTEQALLALAGERETTPWEVLLSGRLDGIATRSVRALETFRDDMEGLRREAGDLPLPTLLRRILDVTKYSELFAKDDAESRSRRENVEELLSAADQFHELHGWSREDDDVVTAFLDHTSLTSDADAATGRGLALMTLHSAKGLEFEAVVVAGLEESLLPHWNAIAHPDDLEEERRLLYVGMTRAARRLFLTVCRRRRVAGRYQDQQPSRFLREIPEDHVRVEEGAGVAYREPAWRGAVAAPQANTVFSFFGKTTPPSFERTVDRSDVEGSDFADPPSDPGDRVIDRSDPTDHRMPGERGMLPKIRRGSLVRHATLGQGRVLALDGAGDDLKLTVYFERSGKRRLVARHANLTVL